MDTGNIRFATDESGNLDPKLFDSTAKEKAMEVAAGERNMNKATQLRRFYDELVMWEAKVGQDPAKFAQHLPFIRMLNAKVAYAEGRKLVDGAFADLIGHCVGQVETVDDLRVFKLFFEAFMGFYKLERPSG